MVISGVNEQFPIKPFVNDVADIGHWDVLIDKDDIVFGTQKNSSNGKSIFIYKCYLQFYIQY